MFQKLLAQCLAQTNGEQMLIVNIVQGRHPKNSAGAKIRAPCGSGPKAHLGGGCGGPTSPPHPLCPHPAFSLALAPSSHPPRPLCPPRLCRHRSRPCRQAVGAAHKCAAGRGPAGSRGPADAAPRTSVLRPGSPRAAGHVEHPLAAVLVEQPEQPGLVLGRAAAGVPDVQLPHARRLSVRVLVREPLGRHPQGAGAVHTVHHPATRLTQRPPALNL